MLHYVLRPPVAQERVEQRPEGLVRILACPRCQGRMKPLALVIDPASIARHLATVGEATEVPQRSPGRDPPYWKSRVLRLQVLGDEDESPGRGQGPGEEVA